MIPSGIAIAPGGARERRECEAARAASPTLWKQRPGFAPGRIGAGQRSRDYVRLIVGRFKGGLNGLKNGVHTPFVGSVGGTCG